MRWIPRRKANEFACDAPRNTACGACQNPATEPSAFSNGKVYCARCIEELVALGWAIAAGRPNSATRTPRANQPITGSADSTAVVT